MNYLLKMMCFVLKMICHKNPAFFKGRILIFQGTNLHFAIEESSLIYE